MCEEYSIKCIIYENEQDGIIQAYENEEDVEIVLKIDDISIAKQADNFLRH